MSSEWGLVPMCSLVSPGKAAASLYEAARAGCGEIEAGVAQHGLFFRFGAHRRSRDTDLA